MTLAVALTAAAPARATPGWIAPTTVSASGTTASAPEIALTPGGETIAAWVRSGVVEVSVRPAGGTFAPPAVVSFAGADPALAPDIAVAPDGRVLLTWGDQCNGGGCVVEAILRGPGGSFGAPVSLSGAGAGVPRGAFTSDGRAIVVWERHAAIESAISTPGGGFTGMGGVVDSSPVDVSTPDIATDGAGRAYLVWGTAVPSASSSVPNAALRLAVSPAGSSAWGAPKDLWSQDSAVDQSAVETVAYASPAIVVDAAGNAAVLWVRIVVHYETGMPSTATTTIQALSRAADGTTAIAQDRDTGITVISGGFTTALSAPDVAVDSLGNAIAVWTNRNTATATTAVRRTTLLAGQRTFSLTSTPASGTGDTAPAAGSASVAALGRGGIMLGYLQGNVVRAAVAQAGGAFGAPAAVSGTGAGLSVPHFSGAADGDAVGAWSMADGSVFRTQVGAYDATPPELRQVQVPATATVGEPVPFSVSLFDAWSGPASSWSFGDDTADAIGTSVSHAFANAGTYAVTVTASDGVGNATAATRTIAVTKPDHRPPTITGLRLTRARFAIASRATAVSARTQRGTTIRFTLSEPATVRLYIKRVLAGHRQSRSCSVGVGAGRRCNVYRAAGKLVRTTGRGRRKVPFTGRIGTRPLRPGQYRLTAIAKDASGNTSKPRRARFTIVSG